MRVVECVNNQLSCDLEGVSVGERFEIKKKIVQGVYILDYIDGPLGRIVIDTENYYFQKSFKFIEE